jgi:hypothetical protein
MPRAVLRNGVVVPVEPLPADWTDGKELLIEEASGQDDSEELKKWIQEVEAAASEIDPKEWQQLQASLDEMHDEAKIMVRRQMGLT